MNKYIFNVEVQKGVFIRAVAWASTMEGACRKVELNECEFDDVSVYDLHLEYAEDANGNEITRDEINEYRDVD